MKAFTHVDTSIGRLLLLGEGDGGRLLLGGLFFVGERHAEGRTTDAVEDAALFAPFVGDELLPFLAGERTSFDVATAARGTPFQEEVWSALREIPYGTTTTYGELARRVGRPLAVRAVGTANGRNPLSIVVPCHRVVGTDGALHGYAGGLAAKTALLALEKRA